jgi:hypothetical protein
MKRSVVAALVLSAALVGIRPAGAAEGFTYGTTTTSRAIETYANIPAEVNQGTPSATVFLEDSHDPFCEGIAGIYDLGLIVDEYASASVAAYQNPTKARVHNPADSFPSQKEVTTFPGGPNALADCASRSDGLATATWGGYVGDHTVVQSAYSKTVSKRVAGTNTVVNEATAHINGIQLGESLIRSFDSWLKVEWKPSEDPVISYRIELQGLTDGKTDTVSSGEKGFVLSGQNVGGGDFITQFNEQAKAHENDLKALGRYGFRMMEPRYFEDTIQARKVIQAAVLEGSLGFTARDGGIGQNQGIRFGLVRTSGRSVLDSTK